MIDKFDSYDVLHNLNSFFLMFYSFYLAGLGCNKSFCAAYWQTQDVKPDSIHTMCNGETFKPVWHFLTNLNSVFWSFSHGFLKIHTSTIFCCCRFISAQFQWFLIQHIKIIVMSKLYEFLPNNKLFFLISLFDNFKISAYTTTYWYLQPLSFRSPRNV